MLVIKHYNVPYSNKEAVTEILSKNEKHIHWFTKKSKEIISNIHFENFHKLVVKIVSYTKLKIIHLKRRFDSKQPKFLLKMENPNVGGKYSVSFFLKNISEGKGTSKKKSL